MGWHISLIWQLNTLIWLEEKHFDRNALEPHTFVVMKGIVTE